MSTDDPDILREKIGLGTVQLGLPYGIHNKTGKPSSEEAFSILAEARYQKVRLLDTAEAYGNSLEVIGAYLSQNPTAGFDVISKFVANGAPVEGRVDKTLKSLGCSSLYAYMYHRFQDYRYQANREELLSLRKKGMIRNLGVSLYDLAELSEVMEDKDVTIVQIPFNPFDNAPKKKLLLKEARKLGKEIHVRSIFLQGLLFKRPEELTGNLVALRDCLKEFHAILREENIDVRQACLNYALRQDMIDRVIVGVETKAQLLENMSSILPGFSNKICEQIDALHCREEALLNPSNWK